MIFFGAELLGVDKAASQNDIKKAYRKVSTRPFPQSVHHEPRMLTAFPTTS